MTAPAPYRGWRIFYEPGVAQHGACQVETGWGAEKGAERFFFTSRMLSDLTGNGYADVKAEIDKREAGHS